MRPVKALGFSFRSLLRHRGRTGLLLAGIVVGVSFLVLLLAFVEGIERAVVDRLVGTLPVTHLQATPRQYAMGALQFDNPFTSLDSSMVARIERQPRVARVMPMAALAVSAQLRASFFGQNFVTDTGVFGIEPGLLGDDLKNARVFARRSAGPVPAFVSRDLVDMYNTGFAASNDLPKLSERILLNQDAVLTIGSSSFKPAEVGSRIDRVPLRIVGVSGNVPLAGISVPIEYVREWNRSFAGERAGREYAAVTVVARDARDVERLTRDLEELGLQVNSRREIAEKVAAIAGYLSLAFAVVGIVILLVAALGIGNALALSVLERRREIGIFRSVGASRGNVRTLFLLEAFVLGAVGSALGIAAALALEGPASRLISRSLPDLPLLPSSFFVNTWQTLALAFIIGVIVSVLAGVSPAARAARLQPAEVLKGA